MQLQEFRDQYLELLLKFLWRQWSSLGVAGYGETNDPWVIDPEALILFTATIARSDQRLFDEMLDWIEQNDRFINVHRLRNILKKENFTSSLVISSIAGKMFKNKSGLKWKGLAGDRLSDGKGSGSSLFYLKSGQPLPVVGEKDSDYLVYGFLRNPVKNRGLSMVFKPKEVSNLLLQLRALIGLNSRSETLLYLLINGKGSIQEIADQSYYAWRSIQDVLYEIGYSAVINSPSVKRGRVYYLMADPWFNILLNKKNPTIQWICWPPFFRALEMIWEKVNNPVFIGMSSLEQTAELGKLVLEELTSRFFKSGMSDFYQISLKYKDELFWDNLLGNLQEILNIK